MKPKVKAKDLKYQNVRRKCFGSGNCENILNITNTANCKIQDRESKNCIKRTNCIQDAISNVALGNQNLPQSFWKCKKKVANSELTLTYCARHMCPNAHRVH